MFKFINNLDNDIFDYENNQPFPHIIIDNFFKSEVLNRILDCVNHLNLNDATHKFLNKKCPYEYNKYAYDISKVNELKDIFDELNSQKFIEFLENLTGIEYLLANMKGGVKGSGIHRIKTGGYLGIHTDFNQFNNKIYGKLDRRLNILIYLNPDWKEEYGGYLKLIEHNNLNNQKKILPILNRCVIFSTTNRSWHGHDEPLKSPENIYRNSIANYYYTKSNGKSDFEGDPPHNTRWWNNNFKDMNGN
jgi:Rps23 Pro-64 3,4-dihydroxylase Tpa1-like proline 4-hydroxylase